METLKKIMPPLISIIALLVSVLSLYVSSLKPAEISLSVGESMQVWHNNDRELNIDLPIIFHNAGSQSGVVRSLGVILKDPTSEEAIFIKWLGFKKLEDRTDGPTMWLYESQRTPVAVPPGGEVSKLVNFYAERSGLGWMPKAITYDLYLLAWTTGSETPTTTKKLTWTFKESDVSDVKHRLDEGKGSGTWILHSSYAAESRRLTTLEFNQLTKLRQ